MIRLQTRRQVLLASAAVGTAALAGCAGEDDENGGDDDGGGTDDENGADDEGETDDGVATGDGEETVPGYEIWALDQGTDTIYVYEPDEDGYDGDGPDDRFEPAEPIDLNDVLDDEGPIVPHMIDFSSDYAYAAIACTGGARTLLFRTDNGELVDEVETGPRTHMATFSPDDTYVHVDVIGDPDEEYGWISRLAFDTDDESIEEVDRIDLSEPEAIEEADVWPARPICHQYAADGRSVHTLGPGHGDGGLVIIDHEEFAVDRAYPQAQAPINCGTMPHYADERFYLTAGRPSDPDEDEAGVGEYYVYDTEDDEFVLEGESADGIDTHGFWFTPDGSELWLLNRETNDGLILDPDDDSVIDEIDSYGPATGDEPEDSDAPDIMWASPDGAYMFVTLRGPAPLSGDAHAATGVTPGFAVFDIEARERVTVVEPDPIDDFDDEAIEAARDEDEDAPRIPDFHGIGVRPTTDFDTDIETSPPY